MKKLFLTLLATLLFTPCVHAQQYIRDLSISEDDISVKANIIAGENARIYATVHNNSEEDLTGVVKFFDESTSNFIGTDQAISVIAQKTDDVFVDWKAEPAGDHPISVRVIPWDEASDNPENNKVTKTIYVDEDFDGDGVGNRIDEDDDNDGTPDSQDDFPLNPNESVDTDGDGIGNNSDTDDDNDGVSDIEDLFPLDPNETVDSDGDGTGDNSDAFPDDPNEWEDSDNDGVGNNSDTNNENHGPIPAITTSSSKTGTGGSITFSATASKDPDGSIEKYEWRVNGELVSEEAITEYPFKEAGEYEINLTLTDDKGEKRTETTTITVKNNSYIYGIGGFGLLLLLLLFLLFKKKKKKKDLPKTK